MKQEEKQAKRQKEKEKPSKKRAEDPQNERWLSLPNYSTAMHRGIPIGLKKIFKNHVEINRNARIEIKDVSNRESSIFEYFKNKFS